MLDSGYVRMYRSFLNWEWYTDQNTKSVFLHLILTANWEPKKWRGKIIQRGQRVCSYSRLSKELQIPIQPLRTAINHLCSTGEITCEATPKYSVVTVKNYDLYQQLTNDQHADSMNKLLTNKNEPKNQHGYQQATNMDKIQPGSQKQDIKISESTCRATNDQHATNMLSTYDQHQLKKDKESNKDKKDKKNIYSEIFSVYAADDAELLQALNDFAEMRKAIKKPFSTERAVKMLLTSLDKLTTDGKEKIAILNQSIFKNWQGVFPLKGDDCNAGQVANNGGNNGARSGWSAEKIPQYGKVY